MKNLIIFIVVGCIAVFAITYVLTTQGRMSAINPDEIANKALIQQDRQAHGTHFSMLSDNPVIRLFLLPYSFFMNLCFPLFYLARNIEGYWVSFENLILISLIFESIRNRAQIKFLMSEDSNLKFIFCFFIVGMLLIALLNTNLGLAVRQKTMYLPCFFVLYSLLYTRKKCLKAHNLHHL